MPPSFDALYASLRRPILALCLHLTGNRADAEDAVQEVFLAVHRGLPSFRGESQAATWVYRIAVRVALRAAGRRRPAGPLPDHHPDPAAHAEEKLLAAERDRKVAAALSQLTAEHRTVLSLFAVEELSHREIAAILNIPEGTAWSRLHLARKRLATVLAELINPG